MRFLTYEYCITAICEILIKTNANYYCRIIIYNSNDLYAVCTDNLALRILSHYKAPPMPMPLRLRLRKLQQMQS